MWGRMGGEIKNGEPAALDVNGMMNDGCVAVHAARMVAPRASMTSMGAFSGLGAEEDARPMAAAAEAAAAGPTAGETICSNVAAGAGGKRTPQSEQSVPRSQRMVSMVERIRSSRALALSPSESRAPPSSQMPFLP